MAEYDALPGYGEQHDELAHACGHNWIGAVCAGVGLMFAQMQEELEGTIVIMGTPAEETTGGKCVLVEEGAFDDVDFAFQLHLGAENNAHVVTLAMDSLEFTFHESSSCSCLSASGSQCLGCGQSDVYGNQLSAPAAAL